MLPAVSFESVSLYLSSRLPMTLSRTSTMADGWRSFLHTQTFSHVSLQALKSSIRSPNHTNAAASPLSKWHELLHQGTKCGSFLSCSSSSNYTLRATSTFCYRGNEFTTQCLTTTFCLIWKCGTHYWSETLAEFGSVLSWKAGIHIDTLLEGFTYTTVGQFG